MLHKFFEKGDWFAPKRFGYGAGLPIAWQGWVLLLGYIAVMAGLAWAMQNSALGGQILGGCAMALATFAVIVISRKRTRGGWHWRG